MQIRFEILGQEFTLHRFLPAQPLPLDLQGYRFYWIGKTDEELSIICESTLNLKSEKQDTGWRAIKLIGPFDLNEVGIFARAAGALAQAGISLFALSTFDTDYLFVKSANLQSAVSALTRNGFSICQ